MVIGISINGILRNTLGKIKEVFEKYEDKIIEGELTYSNLAEKLAFLSDDELIEFLYEEAPIEIFGLALEGEDNVINKLNDFIKSRAEDDIIIISDEIGRSKPATLFFLSKYGALLSEIFFYNLNTINKVWTKVDVLLTDNMDLIKLKPEGKITIKKLNEENKEVSTDYTVNNFEEFTKLELWQIN